MASMAACASQSDSYRSQTDLPADMPPENNYTLPGSPYRAWQALDASVPLPMEENPYFSPKASSEKDHTDNTWMEYKEEKSYAAFHLFDK